jgi:hypothetical protein
MSSQQPRKSFPDICDQHADRVETQFIHKICPKVNIQIKRGGWSSYPEKKTSLEEKTHPFCWNSAILGRTRLSNSAMSTKPLCTNKVSHRQKKAVDFCFWTILSKDECASASTNCSCGADARRDVRMHVQQQKQSPLLLSVLIDGVPYRLRVCFGVMQGDAEPSQAARKERLIHDAVFACIFHENRMELW